MIWIGAVFFPLLLAAVCALPGPGLGTGFRLMPLAPLPALFLALTGYASAGTEMGDFLLKTSLGTGPFGNTFLLITSLTWFFSALFTALGPQNSLKSKSFCVMFLLTMCGNIGLASSRDAVSFYAFFALMTFCAFSLIVHSGKDTARRAGRIYLIMAVLGEGLLIAGIITAVFLSPTHFFVDIAPAMARLPENHTVFLLLWAGFGVKAGLLFLHFWLPLAHPEAPAPASAVLSASMIKAGLLGWMNFFPVGVVSFGSWGMAFAVFGLGGVFFGVMAGLSEKDPKVILAYSSISQVGLMTFCLGLGIWDQALWTVAGPALYLLVFSHALSKSALFLGVAAAGQDTRDSQRKLVLMIMLGIPALILAGAPLTGGAQAKHLLKDAAGAGMFSGIFSILLSLSSVFTTLLMAHFMRRTAARQSSHKYIPGRTMVWLFQVAAILCLPWILYVIYPESRVVWMDSGFFISSALPVSAGLIIYLFMAGKLETAACRIMQSLPDPGLITDKLWYHSNARIREHGLLEADWGRMNLANFTDQLIESRAAKKIPRELELKISTWSVFGMCFILLVIILALLSLTGQ